MVDLIDINILEKNNFNFNELSNKYLVRNSIKLRVKYIFVNGVRICE